MADSDLNLSTVQFKEGTSRVYSAELKADIVSLASSSGEDPSNIGDSWIREIAGQAGADFRTVKNWLNGESTINDNTYNKLTELVTFVKLSQLNTEEELNALFINQDATSYIIDWIVYQDSEEIDKKLKLAVQDITKAPTEFRKNYPNDDMAIIDYHRKFKATVKDIWNRFNDNGLYLYWGMTPRYNQPPKEMWGDDPVKEVRCVIYLISDNEQNFGSIKPNWRKLRQLPLV